MKTMLLRRFVQIYRYNIGWLDIRVRGQSLLGPKTSLHGLQGGFTLGSSPRWRKYWGSRTQFLKLRNYLGPHRYLAGKWCHISVPSLLFISWTQTLMWNYEAQTFALDRAWSSLVLDRDSTNPPLLLGPSLKFDSSLWVECFLLEWCHVRI